MTATDHNLHISRAARAALRPIGCVQKGRSRIWLDDQRWWVTVVEFQPSGWSKGSYLNVGACWLWHARDHFTFDDGHRVDGFQSATDLEDFEGAMAGMAARAREEVLKFRGRFPTVGAVADHLQAKAAGSCNVWDHFHAGVASGLAGRPSEAERHLRAASGAEQRDAEWVRRVKLDCERLLPLARDPAVFRRHIANDVSAVRVALKLPPVDGDVFGDARASN